MEVREEEATYSMVMKTRYWNTGKGRRGEVGISSEKRSA
jgi:hypothetical protein